LKARKPCSEQPRNIKCALCGQRRLYRQVIQQCDLFFVCGVGMMTPCSIAAENPDTPASLAISRLATICTARNQSSPLVETT
jgi:uncharacterized protein (DUF983 family)